MKIQTLGGCCKKSTSNHEAVVEAVKELGLDVIVENVSDINEKVLSAGRSLNVNQAKELISKVLLNSSCCDNGCCKNTK